MARSTRASQVLGTSSTALAVTGAVLAVTYSSVWGLVLALFGAALAAVRYLQAGKAEHRAEEHHRQVQERVRRMGSP